MTAAGPCTASQSRGEAPAQLPRLAREAMAKPDNLASIGPKMVRGREGRRSLLSTLRAGARDTP
jgi:hypothetical protein